MTYEYFCAANGRTVEVRHSMTEKLLSWGEVAACAGIDAGITPADALVERLISGGTLALARRVSRQAPQSYDPVLHADHNSADACLGGRCASAEPAAVSCCAGVCKH